MSIGKKLIDCDLDYDGIVVDNFHDMSDKKLVKRVIKYFGSLNNKNRYCYFNDKKSESYINLMNFVYGLGELVKRKLPLEGKKVNKEDLEKYIFSILPNTDRAIITLSKINSHIKENKLWKRNLPFKKIITDNVIKKRIKDHRILSEVDYDYVEYTDV